MNCSLHTWAKAMAAKTRTMSLVACPKAGAAVLPRVDEAACGTDCQALIHAAMPRVANTPSPRRQPSV